MFRCPQILTRSRPLRPLLLSREGHLSGFSEHPAAGWQAARDAKRWRDDGIPGSEAGSPSTDAVPRIFNSNFDDPKRGEASFQHLWSDAVSPSCRRHLRVPASAKPKAVSAHQDSLTRLQPWRRPRDAGPPSHGSTCRTRCDLLQSSPYCRQHFLRPFSSWILTHAPSQRQPSRALHQAAPREADVWRGCLSLKNENRCRQSLGPNLKLYDAGGKAANRSQGKSQERWASVLVSLCSDRGEPAVLFTLRSRNLTGRHKGDVSFAGGKSDPLDSDVVATALREAREELGVSVATEQVWGTLKPLRDMSGMVIAPVLANLGPIEELSFKPNPGEVEEIFTLSLSHLCNPQNRGYTNFRTGDKYGYTVPVFCNGKHRVWGLTAVALDHTLKLIVPD